MWKGCAKGLNGVGVIMRRVFDCSAITVLV